MVARDWLLENFMAENSINLKNKKLTLFFTYGVGLDLWEKRGLLGREIKLYQRLGEKFGKIYFITYGRGDGRFADMLAPYNIMVLPKKSRLPNFIYSLLIPFYYRHELKQCDFYKTNQMLGSWSAVIAKWWFGKKLIVRTGYPLSINARKENLLKYLLSKLIERIAAPAGDILVVATEIEKKYFAKYADKIRVIPNFVDTDLFRPMPELKSTNNIKIVLFVGRLSPEKNLKNLILAMADNATTRLQIIGSGEERDSLELLAKQNHVLIEFIGNVAHDKLPEYINRADLFVLPSLYEGNPKVLLEAMSCGAMVLGTDVRGINNIILDGANGFLAMGTSVGLREKINRLLANLLSEESIKIKTNARQCIVEDNSLDKITQCELLNF